MAMIKAKQKPERWFNGEARREFDRRMTMRLARGNARLAFGRYLDAKDMEQIKKDVLKHDFSRV